MKRIILGAVIFCMVFLCSMPALTIAEEEKQAEELTKSCSVTISADSDSLKEFLNNRLSSYATLRGGTKITVKWGEDVPAAKLCLQWLKLPEGVRVIQYDRKRKELSNQQLDPNPESVISLDSAAASVLIVIGKNKAKLSQLHVFSEGTLPEPFHEWTETPEKLDYLLIATHPDDDVLYLGSVVPYYGAERGYTGSIAFVTCMNRTRMTEAENGAWAMGLRYRPLFLGFPDVPNDSSKRQKATFVYDDLVLAIVRLYRTYHPLVVFAQDTEGEYGHWQHKRTAKASLEAFSLAADPAYDPESAEQLGTWQVQKLFLHLYPINKLTIDADTPLEAFGGKDAFQVAKEAFKKHVSQQKTSFAVRKNNGAYAFNQFGMAAGTVEVGRDVFDNIDRTQLSFYDPLEPEPTEEPTPEPTEEPTPKPTEEPTPEPTEEPTPEPTEEPTPEPTEEPTPKPSGTPAPQSSDEMSTERKGGIPLTAAVATGTLSVILMGSGLYLMHKGNKTKENRKDAAPRQ